jgi:hypothetical protein
MAEEIKKIGERITVKRSKERWTILISQSTARWHETALLIWLLAWTFCGIVFIKYLIYSEPFNDRMFFAVSTAVWMFFFYRIIKAFLWRKSGEEVITFEHGKMSLRNKILGRGRIEDFNFDNVFKLGLVKRDPANFFSFLDDSFWVIGGDRIGFNYGKEKIRFGKQLNERDAELLLRVVQSAMKQFA